MEEGEVRDTGDQVVETLMAIVRTFTLNVNEMGSR